MVDQFFTQASIEYSPPAQDLQLHAAGIIAYGVRLGEGEARAIPELFHYLHLNFQLALANERLDEECSILEKAMGNSHVLSFMLSKMLPAIIHATAETDTAWPLLDVYSSALHQLLTRSYVPMEIDEKVLGDVIQLLDAILDWIRAVQKILAGFTLSHAQVYVLVELTALANLFQPRMDAYSYLSPQPFSPNLNEAVESFAGFVDKAEPYLRELLELREGELSLDQVRLGALFIGVKHPFRSSLVSRNPQLEEFTKRIVSDIRTTWVVTEDTVSTKLVGRASTQSHRRPGQGTKYEAWNTETLLRGLLREVRSWKIGRVSRRKRPQRCALGYGDEIML
jgi:hypothetical protein